MKNKQKILITTGIYPPKIGGPAQYSKNLKETFEKMGFETVVKTYCLEDRLPTGIRHLFFFLKIIPSVLYADKVFILDTFSVGLPTVIACKIFGKTGIIRTGGDFLWEQYVENRKKKVLLTQFYKTEKQNFSFKERLIFKLTKWTLNNATKVIFSTDWQRKIFIDAYSMNVNKTFIVENFYGDLGVQEENYFDSKTFVASARNLVWKNFDVLKKTFEEVKKEHQDIILFTDNLPYQKFVEKIRSSYAVILVSLSDISPNMILDAIRARKPFICTKEVGIYDRIKDAGIFVDPSNEVEIKQAVKYLLTEDGYKEALNKVKNFNFVHTWEDIAKEFLEIANK